MYQPFVFKLDTGKSDILDKSKTNNVILSSNINLPLNSLGFHTFLHRTKSAMSITKNLETKNEFYYVVSPFEPLVPNYEDSLQNLAKHYFNIKEPKPEIMSRDFYKLWEIMFLFGVADKKDINYAAIAEGTGSFIQTFINYREKLGQGVSNDKIFGVGIQTEKGNHVEMAKQFLGFYDKKSPELINFHKINVKELPKHGAKAPDVISSKTISTFKKDMDKAKVYADLVTADGVLDWYDDNYQEQEAYQLILGEIIAAIKVSAKDANFVLRIFESFTIPTIKMIYLLSSFYEETYIYKPFFSRQSESEKYIVCKGFKYDQKKDMSLLKSKLESLENTLEQMNSNKFVFDIYPDLELPINYIDKFKYYNIEIANPQQIIINEIIKYIKENNYFGEKYHMFRDKQIESTKWWINNFFPPSSNLYEKTKEDMKKLVKLSLDKNESEITKFVSMIVR